MKFLFFLLFSASVFAQMPTYWGIGLNAADNMNNPGKNGFAFDGKNLGFAASLEFGQLFSQKFGYNIRLVSASFREFLHQDLYYVSGGLNYYFSSFNFNANVTYGNCKYQVGFIIIGDPDLPPVEGSRINVKQNGAVGFEVGVSKKIIGGLWGQVYFHHTPLDRHKVSGGSLDYQGIGVKYLWGRHWQ